MLTRYIISLLVLVSPSLWAQTAPPTVPTPQTLEQAEAQRQRAETMRQSAEKRHAEEQAACYRKFLVNSCLDDTKKRYTNAMIEARQLDIPAREFQREAKRQALSQKLDSSYWQKLEDKERKAAENRQKLAEEQAQRKAKDAKRAQKHAEQIEKKARERTKAEAKAAAKPKSE